MTDKVRLVFELRDAVAQLRHARSAMEAFMSEHEGHQEHTDLCSANFAPTTRGKMPRCDCGYAMIATYLATYYPERGERHEPT